MKILKQISVLKLQYLWMLHDFVLDEERENSIWSELFDSVEVTYINENALNVFHAEMNIFATSSTAAL